MKEMVRNEKANQRNLQRVLYGLILIGGESSRMGRPKHLLKMGGNLTLVESQYALLSKICEKVILAGEGKLPESLDGCERVADHPDGEGPMAGIGGAMSRYPRVDWIVLACDMPAVTKQAVTWLCEQKKDECVGVVPCYPESETGNRRLEPLFALYGHQIKGAIMTAFAAGRFRMSVLAEIPEMCVAEIPDHLKHCWENINNPSDLERVRENGCVSE